MVIIRARGRRTAAEEEARDSLENTMFELVEDGIWEAFEEAQHRQNTRVLLPDSAAAKIDGLIDEIVKILTNK